MGFDYADDVLGTDMKGATTGRGMKDGGSLDGREDYLYIYFIKHNGFAFPISVVVNRPQPKIALYGDQIIEFFQLCSVAFLAVHALEGGSVPTAPMGATWLAQYPHISRL
ncbi:hypothetical protein FF1_032310 [Malus domestica]